MQTLGTDWARDLIGLDLWTRAWAKGIDALPGNAQRTLDQIADALGVATAVLKEGAGAAVPSAGSTASLAEASALL